MSEAPLSRTGLQIGLKWLLIGVPIAGAGLGLLGRLFYHDPNQFRLAIMLVMVVAPFLLAVGTVIRLGWGNRRRILMAWGMLLAITPLVGYGVLRFANHLYGAHGYGIVDNTTLIKQRLPNELTTPWVWQELEKRIQSSSLSQAEVDETIQTLTSHMKKTHPQGWSGPLHWEGKFIELAAKKQLVSQQTLFDLCDVFYGSQLTLDHFSGMPGFRGNHRIGVEFGNHWAFHTDLPIKLIWCPSKVLVDGKTVPFETDMSHGNDWDGSFSGSFPMGDHELTVEVECAYVDNTSRSPFDTGCVERTKWPKQLHKSWTTNVTDKRHLMSMGGSGTMLANRMSRGHLGMLKKAKVIKLSTRSSDDPLANNAVQVPSITITSGRNNVSTASIEISIGESLSIPVSWNITAQMGGQTFEFGSFYAGKIANTSFRSSSGNEVQIGNVGEQVKSAGVTLTPNPLYIEQVPGVTEIWGKPIVIPDVPIKRFGNDEAKP